jgi:hypothetical protein
MVIVVEGGRKQSSKYKKVGLNTESRAIGQRVEVGH